MVMLRYGVKAVKSVRKEKITDRSEQKFKLIQFLQDNFLIYM